MLLLASGHEPRPGQGTGAWELELRVTAAEGLTWGADPAGLEARLYLARGVPVLPTALVTRTIQWQAPRAGLVREGGGLPRGWNFRSERNMNWKM